MNEAGFEFDTPLDNFLLEDHGEIENGCGYLDTDPSENLISNFDTDNFFCTIEPIPQIPIIQDLENDEPVKTEQKYPKTSKKKDTTKRMSFTYKHSQATQKITNMMATRHKLSDRYNHGNYHHRMTPRNHSAPFRDVPRIRTPDWFAADISQGDDISPHRLSPYTHKINCMPFDRVGSHQKLEICEARIREGFNKKYAHPAMANQLIEDGLTIVMTQKEFQKNENYENEYSSCKIPSFWPPRIWDAQNTCMSDHENEKISRQIVEALESHVTFPTSSIETLEENPKKKRGRKPRVKAVIELSLDNFATDPEDDSDWDDL